MSFAIVETYIFISEPIAHRGEQLSETILGDKAVVVLVEAAEGILNDILWISSLQALAEEREEHGEVDRSRCFVHHGLEVVVGRVFAQRRQHVVEILFLDESVAILIDHVEGFLKWALKSLRTNCTAALTLNSAI